MIGHYLLFDRCCAQALDAYAKAFDARICEKQTYGDMPANPAFPVPEDKKDLVLHARLSLFGTELMCADSQGRTAPGDNMYVTLTTKDEAAVRKAWDALAQGGEVYMPLQPSFFAKQHGSLRDRFGVNWMFTVMN